MAASEASRAKQTRSTRGTGGTDRLAYALSYSAEDAAVHGRERGVTLGGIECKVLSSENLTNPLGIVQDLIARLDAGEDRAYGFPAARNGIDYSPLYPLLTRAINNIGDPGIPAAEPRHCKDLEREVISSLGHLFRRDETQLWGYITSGSTEAIRHALLLARHRLPNAILYYSEASHYCLAKAANALRIPSVRVPTFPSGEIDYAALSAAVRSRSESAIVAATAGTPMSEAVDDVQRIRDVTADRPLYVHLDAALSGFALAVGWPELIAGPDSISVSGHKLLAFRNRREPCSRAGAMWNGSGIRWRTSRRTTRPNRDRARDNYRCCGGGPYSTSALRRAGAVLDGLASTVVSAVQVAEYAHSRLEELGWEPYRHPWGLTVRFVEPPQEIGAAGACPPTEAVRG